MWRWCDGLPANPVAEFDLLANFSAKNKSPNSSEVLRGRGEAEKIQAPASELLIQVETGEYVIWKVDGGKRTIWKGTDI